MPRSGARRRGGTRRSTRLEVGQAERARHQAEALHRHTHDVAASGECGRPLADQLLRDLRESSSSRKATTRRARNRVRRSRRAARSEKTPIVRQAVQVSERMKSDSVSARPRRRRRAVRPCERTVDRIEAEREVERDRADDEAKGGHLGRRRIRGGNPEEVAVSVTTLGWRGSS